MFDKAEARYVLRCALFGVSAFLVSLQASGADGWLQALITGGIVGLGYAGIGAASPQIEPFIGNKLNPPPEPPSGDTDA